MDHLEDIKKEEKSTILDKIMFTLFLLIVSFIVTFIIILTVDKLGFNLELDFSIVMLFVISTYLIYKTVK